MINERRNPSPRRPIMATLALTMVLGFFAILAMMIYAAFTKVQLDGTLKDVLLVMIGSLGGSIDTLLKPLYEDTVLAWWSVKSTERAQKSGKSRYFEYFQDGANKAYTIASLMVLRAGYWATKTTISNKMSVIDGAPYMVGDNGVGHWWLDDRIGFVVPDDPTGRIWMDRARKIELNINDDGSVEWVPTIGDDRNLQDPAQKAWGRIEQMVASLRELGVW